MISASNQIPVVTRQNKAGDSSATRKRRDVIPQRRVLRAFHRSPENRKNRLFSAAIRRPMLSDDERRGVRCADRPSREVGTFSGDSMKIAEPRQTFVAPPGRHSAPRRFALFNLGFRPFYLAGALCAALALTV
jgi:hypothetical protein